MKKTSILFGFLIVFLSIPFFPSIPAQTNPHEIWITLNEPYYYIKGDTIQIQAFSNVTTDLTLSVYWNWKQLNDNELIYRSTKTSNASWNLPTSNQKVGFYHIIVNSSETKISTWRTLFHTTDYAGESLPFSYEWTGINYTLQGRTVRAEKENDYVEITYPKIPFKHRTRFYRNNMTFLVRLDNQTQGWNVDVLYALMPSGIKWIVEGQLNNPVTFDFQVAHNPLKMWKRRLESFHSGSSNLVFDWNDLKKAQKAFIWNPNTKTLHVTIPESFSIDPAIFEDGFESGNFSAWTSTTGSPNVVDTQQHTGTYSMKCNSTTSNEWHGANKNFDSQTSTFWRYFVRFDDLPANNKQFNLGFMEDGSNHKFIRPMLKTISDTVKWGFGWTDNGGYNEAWSNEQTNPLADTWQMVEWETLPSTADGQPDGEYRAYVNGSQLTDIEQTGVDTDYTNVLRIEQTASTNDAGGYTLWIDCVVVDSSYVGSEGTEKNVYGVINQVFSISSYRTFALTRMGVINQQFSLSSYQTFSLNRYTLINQQFTISSYRTYSLNRMGVINQVFTISSYVASGVVQRFLGAIGQQFSVGSYKVVSGRIEGVLQQLWTNLGETVFPEAAPTYATIGFVLVCFILAAFIILPLVALIWRRRQ